MNHSTTLQAIRANARPKWYEIVAKKADAPDEAEVFIYGEIGDSFWGESVSARQFAKDLAGVTAEKITFRINSPGGEVFDATAIANAISIHPAHTTARVEGLAASGASLIAVSADETVMMPGSQLMIHDAWGFAIGNAADMKEVMDLLDHLSDGLAEQYAAKAGGEPKAWRKAMKAETWYSADEAVAAGLADRVLPRAAPESAGETPEKAGARDSFDLSPFKYAGRQQAPAPMFPSVSARVVSHPARPVETQPPKGADSMSDTLLNGLREKLGLPADADEAAVLAAVDARRPSPPGTVLVDASALATMQETLARVPALEAAAAEGVAARKIQIAAHREQVVAKAIDLGKIPPSKRQGWLDMLEADPTAEETLAALEPGLIPLQPKGYTGGLEEADEPKAKQDQLIQTVGWGDILTTEQKELVG